MGRGASVMSKSSSRTTWRYEFNPRDAAGRQDQQHAQNQTGAQQQFAPDGSGKEHADLPVNQFARRCGDWTIISYEPGAPASEWLDVLAGASG